MVWSPEHSLYLLCPHLHLGFYDVEYTVRETPNARGRLHSTAEGKYAFRCGRPLAYPVPDEVRMLLLHINFPESDVSVSVLGRNRTLAPDMAAAQHALRTHPRSDHGSRLPHAHISAVLR